MFNELELVGSHGMQAHLYPRMLEMITSGILQPHKLISKTVTLEESLGILQTMGDSPPTGVVVIDRFN
jgi:alcohol dehydrogenase